MLLLQVSRVEILLWRARSQVIYTLNLKLENIGRHSEYFILSGRNKQNAYNMIIYWSRDLKSKNQKIYYSNILFILYIFALAHIIPLHNIL